MKNYILTFFLIIFAPIQLFADGPFLYSLPFDSRIYPEETILEKTKVKGIDYSTFEKYLVNNKIELGKKVGLISELEVFFVLNSNQKSYFIEYKEKFTKALEKKYGTKIPVNERFLITLMNDYDTETPNIEAYQKFVDENALSRTMQFVNVFAFNFELLWKPEKRIFDYLSDFKEKYQDNCLQNFESFEDDVPVDIKDQLYSIIHTATNCGYYIPCLSPKDMDSYGFIYGLSENVLNNLANAVPIPDMAVKNNAEQIGVLANNWIVAEYDVIRDLKIDENYKKLLTYFLANEAYYYVNNYGTGNYYDLLHKSKNDLAKIDFEKSVAKTVKKKNIETAKKAYQDFKNIYSKIPSAEVGRPTADDLKNLFHYLYLNPNELNKIFINSPNQ